MQTIRDPSLPGGGTAGSRMTANPRDFRSYAGAQSAITGQAASANYHQATFGGGLVNPKVEKNLEQAKTKSDARAMVATMVAERLAACGIAAPGTSAGCTSPAPTATGAYSDALAPKTPRTPKGASDALPTPASIPSVLAMGVTANTGRRTPNGTGGNGTAPGTGASSVAAGGPTGITPAAAQQPPGRGASPAPGASASASASVRAKNTCSQPVWRPGGSAPPKAPTPAAEKGPRSWLTREELNVALDEQTRRAEAAEAAAEGARMAAELLQDEAHAAEAREAEAVKAAEAARAHALTIGDLEVKLRVKLEEQGEQLARTLNEEAALRDEAAKAQRACVELKSALDHSDARENAASRRAEKSERVAKEAREALAEAKATQATVDALSAQLREAKEAASTFRSLAADEASAKRSLGNLSCLS